MNIKEFKYQYDEYVQEDVDVADDYLDKIERHFLAYLKNPTDKQSEIFRSLRDAFILALLTDLFKKWKRQSKQAVKDGYNVAKQQLDDKKITDIVNKKIKVDDILNVYKAKSDSVLADMTVVTEQIKANSERVIKDVQNNLIETRAKISSELLAIYGENGITYYTDTAGRRHSIKDYVKMKSLTLIMESTRSSLFNEAIRRGVDTVKIIHLNIHPHCELCEPFTNAILSISGKTDGLMTVDEAFSAGLWHAYCDDVPVAYELAPADEPKEIKLNEKNKKRQQYMKRKGYKFNL